MLFSVTFRQEIIKHHCVKIAFRRYNYATQPFLPSHFWTRIIWDSPSDKVNCLLLKKEKNCFVRNLSLLPNIYFSHRAYNWEINLQRRVSLDADYDGLNPSLPSRHLQSVGMAKKDNGSVDKLTMRGPCHNSRRSQ